MEQPRDLTERLEAMEIQHDVSLEYVLEQVTLHPDRTGVIPLAGLDSEIRMRAAETPGTYRVAVWSTGAEPFQKTEAATVNGLQFAVLFKPLVNKNRAVLEKRGRRLAEDVENFLKESA